MDPDPTKRVENKETIVQAAMKFPDGEIFTGEQHSEILAKLPWEKLRTQKEAENGFVTSKGRFVSRKEAEDIAFDAGQIKVKMGKLISQNLKH